MNNNKILTLLISIIFLLSCNSKHEKIDLSLNLIKGEEFKLKYEMIVDNPLVKMNSIRIANFKVDSIFEDYYLLKCNLLYVREEYNLGGSMTKYNSNMDEAKLTKDQKKIFNEFKHLLDSTLLLKINKKGKVIQSFSFISGKNTVNNPFPLKYIQLEFPKDSVLIGSEWKVKTENPNILGDYLTSTYRITSIKTNVIEIEEIQNIPGVEGLIRAKVNKGKIKLDRHNGTIINQRLEMKMTYGGKTIISCKREN